MSDFANTEEGAAKSQMVEEGINQLRQHGAFDVQGTMPAEMIEKIFSAGWLMGERWAERQSRERDKSTSGHHVEYREGYRDGYKDGNQDGHEAAVARLNAPRGPPALSVESDTTFGSNTTQLFGSPQLRSVLDASLTSNSTEDRQKTPQEPQEAITSIVPKDTCTTIEQPKSVAPGQVHNAITTTTSQNQQPNAFQDVEEKCQPFPPPAPDNQHIKVEVRQSPSPMAIDGKDLSVNKGSTTPSLHSKRADSLVDSVEKPASTEGSERSENRPKRSREVVETVENHGKSEHRPKRPKEDGKGNEGKRKRITASTLGNFVYSPEDGLDTKDLLLNTCPDSLRRRTCELGPDDQTNCLYFHLCPRYAKGCCDYPNHHGNWLHFLPTCVSVIRNRHCYNPHSCGFGHDHSEVRVRRHSSLNATHLESQARGRPTSGSIKKPDSISDRPAAYRIASRDSPSRERRPAAERSRSIPSGPAADRRPLNRSPRR